MTKKIFFIIPPHGSFDSYKPKGSGQKKNFLTPPYGALSIISFINKRKKHNIKIFDCNKEIFEHLDSDDLETTIFDNLNRIIMEFKPDYIFISALFNTSFQHMKIVRLLKTNNPNSLIFIGGGLATNLHRELFEEFPEIDAICYGEGEIPVLKLLNTDTPIDKLHTISFAWVTKYSLFEGYIPQHDVVKNIDTIPLIDFSYIDLTKYNGRSYIDKDPNSKKIEVSIHTSRGCPFNCVFCANGKLHGKKVRMMSFEKVAETIKHYYDNYGLTILLVEDDHFLYDKERALKILEFIKDNNINVEFPNGIAVYKVDNDIAQALVAARVKLITLAIESGSDYVLKELIDKPLDTKKIKEVVDILKNYNIRIHVFVVIGIPGEFDSHRQETLKFIIDLKIDWAYIFIAIPIVGSRLYKICKDNNYLINNNFDKHIISYGNIKAPGVDPKEIEDYAYYMNTMINFIFNSNFLDGKYDVAEEYFLTVVRSYPEQAVAHYMLSLIYKEKDPEKSNTYYTKYLQYYDTHLGKYKNSRFWKGIGLTYLTKSAKIEGITCE